eukprot:TRINITY_DN337_c0_g1_i12.p1 TRINITY_DN337_c0_g1~~TRINITY_DN337_c0_g1_i12.p1  ORF type:complete len:342 (+),score=34.00 TRINITY_DN337_c0_g1_i12:143-1168(+)
MLSYFRSCSVLRLSHSNIWILGREINGAGDINVLQQELQRRISRLIWFSYRRGFEPIQGHTINGLLELVLALPYLPEIMSKSLTSDAGWGCQLRTGQMLLASALLRESFSEDDWENGNPHKYSQVLRRFNDCFESVYSIHNIAIQGVDLGKSVGQWFGPGTISTALKQLGNNDNFLPLKIYTATNCLIDSVEIEDLVGGENGWQSSLLILIPTRIGVTCVNPVYYKTLQAYMSISQSIGFIGGKPNASYYFVGFQDNTLFYLDPHVVQKSVKILDNSKDCDLQTYFYTLSPSWMKFEHLDESLALGFYCRHYNDFVEFVKRTLFVRGGIFGDFRYLFQSFR